MFWQFYFDVLIHLYYFSACSSSSKVAVKKMHLRLAMKICDAVDSYEPQTHQAEIWEG